MKLPPLRRLWCHVLCFSRVFIFTQLTFTLNFSDVFYFLFLALYTESREYDETFQRRIKRKIFFHLDGTTLRRALRIEKVENV